jgi:hypothetical protein
VSSAGVTLDWPVLRVWLNGVLVQDINRELSGAMRSKARGGYIGLDDLNCRIQYRNIGCTSDPIRIARGARCSTAGT